MGTFKNKLAREPISVIHRLDISYAWTRRTLEQIQQAARLSNLVDSN